MSELLPDRSPPPPDDGATDEIVECVRAARNGDDDAFDRLVKRFQRRAVSVAYRLLGNLHDAADVAQEAFLRAYRHLDRLDDPRRFGGWLIRIVTNQALNFRRSRARSAAVSSDEWVENQETLRTASGALVGGMDVGDASTRQLQAAIAAALADLPPKQRTALVLFSIEGMPQKEVAEVMNCTVELVKWNVFQARKALRKALQDHVD